ncbi:hypothetical protein L7F22_001525 [Adiantum nelumboides]|nr:hypothetical protein [Adiantum nelumboides]
MSSRGPRCAKHPSNLLVGVCAFCLRERLAGLSDAERAASDTSYNLSSRRKKQSPGCRLGAVPGAQNQSSERNACDQPHCNDSVEHLVKEGLQDDPLPCIASLHLHVETDKNMKSVVVDSILHTLASKLNKLPVSETSPEALATVDRRPISVQTPKPLQTSLNTARENGVTSMETPPWRGHRSLAKKPCFTPVKCNKLPPVDIIMPMLENDLHLVTETKINVHLQKHASAGCKSPLVWTGEPAKHVPAINQACTGASLDSERNVCNSDRGAVSHLMILEPTAENGKDEELPLSDAFSNAKQKKKTLSSLFSLDDSEFAAWQGKAEEFNTIKNVKEDAMINGLSTAPVQNVLQANPTQSSYKHGSFSERVELSTYLFPVPETANSKPLSWLSAIFRRRKKKSHSKTVFAASYSEHNSGWEAARQSWEAPRPSAWEQFRYSSFEGPRSSWEPARPSWEGVMRSSDGEFVFSGLDFLSESLRDVKENTVLAHKKQQEPAEGGCMNGFSEAKRSMDRNGFKPSVMKPHHWVNTDRPHTFLSTKASLMQRDVSTQTTPPRASDATEIFTQKKLQQDGKHHGQHYTRGAVWNKVWTKTFSNSKWAFKHKTHKERCPKEMADAMVSIDEVHDHGTMTSGRSFPHEGMNIASNHYPKLTCIDKIEEYEAWDTFCSPLQQSREAMTRLASKADVCIQKDKQVDTFRGSNCALDNGLLKFYLTPVRGLAKNKQENYAALL